MKPTRIVSMLLVMACLVTAVPAAFSQGASILPAPGRYGLTSWAINNQRVASQYNYFIDSLFGSGLGSFTFPPGVIYQAVPKGSNAASSPPRLADLSRLTSRLRLTTLSRPTARR